MTEQEYPQLYRDRPRADAGRPACRCPQIYVSDMPQPNAFATGRNPKQREGRGHEGHPADPRRARAARRARPRAVPRREPRHPDLARSPPAIGMSITLPRAVRASSSAAATTNSGGNALGLLFAWILAPIAAAIIQMAVSRSREYQADESGALLSQDPEALASALRKLEATSKQVPPPATRQPGRGAPVHREPAARRLRGRGFANLFSTHPPTDRACRAPRGDLARLRGGTPIGS